MSRKWIDETLLQIGLDPVSRFPRDLITEVVMRLSVTVVSLSSLTTNAVRDWLGKRGVHNPVAAGNRDLHGCLIARAAHGIVFLDALDDEGETRFTFAHEIAHFILDHLLPRLKAVKFFGDRIVPALNGDRAPTTDEMLSATLQRVRLGVHVHLMTRGPKGSICGWEIEESEQRADRLALELLAPSRVVRAELERNFGNAGEDTKQQRRLYEYLAETFGLPPHVAISYMNLLQAGKRKRRRLSEEILGSK